MTDTRAHASDQPLAAPTVVACADLCAAIADYTGQRGYRLDMIMPADAPRIALVSRGGACVRLEVAAESDALPDPSEDAHGFVMSRSDRRGAWPEGRAGMQYRDLIPGRLRGRAIASHIRIPEGGPVPDYVHYHKVGFQMIHCRRGWVRVVYEDQGPPFVMREGDCVLQPPTIRHRVLEASAGLEVVEVGCPAVHETWRDHELVLPTPELHPDREFGGQRFVRHVATQSHWRRLDARFDYRDTGIADATDGLASVRVLRAVTPSSGHPAVPASRVRDGGFVFLFVLEGRLQLRSDAFGAHAMEADDGCAIPGGADFLLDAHAPCEVLEVAMPARQEQ